MPLMWTSEFVIYIGPDSEELRFEILAVADDLDVDCQVFVSEKRRQRQRDGSKRYGYKKLKSMESKSVAELESDAIDYDVDWTDQSPSATVLSIRERLASR